MRLFQNSGVYSAYLPRLRRLTAGRKTFAEQIRVFLDDRFGAAHFLEPVLQHDPQAFFTNGDDEQLQRQWAREMGMPHDASLEAILLAQIEHHRTEVFYNLDLMRYGSDFARRLPGCVKRTVAWRAAPSRNADFGGFDALVCNFPSILRSYEERGWRTAYFAPAHDPVMDDYAANTERPIDVIFVGGYSRHHRRRAATLEAVATLEDRMTVVLHLDRSRLTRLAESPLGRMLPLGRHRRPPDIRAASAAPVFGRDLYEALSRAKVVLNGAVDMAGEDRGNMRCFEAMGLGCVMVSDRGNYPEQMEEGRNMLTYADADDAVRVIERALADPAKLAALASEGTRTMRSVYTKSRQWRAFQHIVEDL